MIIYRTAKFRLEDMEGFEWTESNVNKNYEKHKVSWRECEEVFASAVLVIVEDSKHSALEQRFLAYGETKIGRKLFVVFTMRSNYIRVISARDQSKIDKLIYERARYEANQTK